MINRQTGKIFKGRSNQVKSSPTLQMLGSGFIPVIMGFLNVFCARETLAIHNPIKINKSLQLFFIILILKFVLMAKFTIIRQKQGSLCFKVRNVFFQDSVFRFKYKAIMLHSESLARHRRE